MDPDDDYHYESRLCWLWEKETLNQVRLLVKRGEIDASKIWRLAQNPRVKALNTYNANRHLEIEETFERILQFWVDQKLFGLKPPEAQDLLLEVLNDSLCSP